MAMVDVPADQKVWVGNLTADTTVDSLQAHFAQLGDPMPISAVLMKRGVGVVAYATAQEAETAIAAFNGSDLSGNSIQTDSWTTSKPKGASRGLNLVPYGGGKGKGKAGFGKWGGEWDAWGKGGKWGGMDMMGMGEWGPPGWGMGDPMAWKGAMMGKGAGWGMGAMKGGWGPGSGIAAAAAAAAAAEEKAAAEEGATGSMIWIAASNSALTQQGFPAEGAAFLHEKGNNVFSSSAFVLKDALGDIASNEVEIVHDADQHEYPDIAAAIKAATGEPWAFALAVCASQAKWGLGLASGWKGRESAAKLALAASLASDNPELAGKLAKAWPEFGDMCKKQGFQVVSITGSSGSGDVPAVHWLKMGQGFSLVTQGFPTDAPAIQHTKAQKLYFSCAHDIIHEFITELSEEVQIKDDPEGLEFPEVQAAIRASGAEDNCYCVATCPEKGVWAVGLGGGYKGRESAAKVSLVLALAQATGRIEELGSNFPEFGEICAGAGLMRGAKKQRRGGK